MADYYVSSGQVDSGRNLGSSDYQCVEEGGIASYTTVYSGGELFVCGGGSAIGVVQKAGGNVNTFVAPRAAIFVSGVNASGGILFLSGGVASGFILYSGGMHHVWGGTASGTVVSSGGQQSVVFGGVACDTALFGGSQYVESNCTTSGTMIYSGGKQFVAEDGLAFGTRIKFGGRQDVQGKACETFARGGTASNTVVSSGGTQYIFRWGTASLTSVLAGGSTVVASKGNLLTATVAGSLTAKAGAKLSAVTLKSGAKLSIADGNALYGKNGFTGATVTGGKNRAVTLAKNASITVGAKTNMKGFHLDASSTGASISFTGAGATLGSLKLSSATAVSYSIAKLKAKGSTLMLSLSSKNSQNVGKFFVTIAKNQSIGTYELSNNIVQSQGMAYTVKLGSTKLGTAKLNGTALTKNGVAYKVKTSGAQINLVVAMKAGKMLKGNVKANKLTGGVHSDVFYGGKGNDTITGKNGRDVAVYDKTAWGKDKIVKTGGTMTILFKDLKKADVVQKLKGTTMTLTRKGDKSQSITVQGWNKATHNVVFGGTMNSFAKWLKASKPTAKVTTATRNEAWKKAKLAQA